MHHRLRDTDDASLVALDQSTESARIPLLCPPDKLGFVGLRARCLVVQ